MIFIYIGLLFAGFFEELISVFYYKLIQKHYKILCAIVSMLRTFLWAFVLINILENMNQAVWKVIVYAIGGAIGDYVSLSIEPYVEKTILKLPRRGRKKKWWYFIIEKRK